MSWLLDTSTVSRCLSGRAAPPLVERADRAIREGTARVCTVTVFEVARGLRKLELLGGGQGRRRRLVFDRFMQVVTLLGVDDPELRLWYLAAELHARAAVERPAVVFGDADLLLLATAVVHGMVLLTCDAKLVANAARLGLEASVELVDG